MNIDKDVMKALIKLQLDGCISNAQTVHGVTTASIIYLTNSADFMQLIAVSKHFEIRQGILSVW